jgi:hypothetical protein
VQDSEFKFQYHQTKGKLWPKSKVKVSVLVGSQWLTPVILATQEAEIRRIVVQSQLRQIVRETLSLKYLTQKGLVE